jgi:hypothetical protein
MTGLVGRKVRGFSTPNPAGCPRDDDAQGQLVDVSVTRYYHCISRCVRQAFLCGECVTHRKAWIETRLELLAKDFALSVCGFAILDNHLYVLCRLDPGASDGWSVEDVVRRWIATLFPECLVAA